VIAGSPSSPPGYQEGQGTKAVFHWITAIFEEGQYYLVVDNRNHCLRNISMNDYSVQTYAGQCTFIGTANGNLEESAFNFPHGMARNGENEILVTDKVGIRSIDRNTMTVFVLYRCCNPFPSSSRFYDLVIGDDNTVLLTIDHAIVKYSQNRMQILAGGQGKAQTCSSCPFKMAQLDNPRGLWILDKDIVLVAERGDRANRITVLNRTDNSLSIVREILHKPRCITAVGNFIYIGVDEGISKMAYTTSMYYLHVFRMGSEWPHAWLIVGFWETFSSSDCTVR